MVLRDWHCCTRAARASEDTGTAQRTLWRVCGGSSGRSHGWGNTKSTSKPRATASPFSHHGSRPPFLGTCPSLQGQITALIIQHGGPHGKTNYMEQQQVGRRCNVRRSYIFSNSTEKKQLHNTADGLFKSSPGWAWSWDERCIFFLAVQVIYAEDHTSIKLARNTARYLWRRAGKAQTSQVSFQTVTRHSLLPQLSPCSVITVCRTIGTGLPEFIIDALLCYQYAGNTAATLGRRDSFVVLIFHTSTIQCVRASALPRKPEILGPLLALMWTCAAAVNHFSVFKLSHL